MKNILKCITINYFFIISDIVVANDKQIKCNTGSLALSCYINYAYVSIYFGEVYYSGDLIQLVDSPLSCTSGVTLILSKETRRFFSVKIVS